MINTQLLKSYIKHRLTAKTRHGVHSPFVYRLIDEVIYNFKPRKEYREIESLREKLLKDERFITITDLGAGSHVNNNKQKQVKQLAKNALKTPKLAQLIYRLVNEHKPANIIELGTCLGLTTAYMAKAGTGANIISIEGCPETAAVAKENLDALNVHNAEVRTGDFDERFPEVIDQVDKLDFVFIDGNHRKEATLNYFRWCLPKVHEGSVLIFDDIYWSKGMEEAWKEIKAHPQVTVSIDLFWVGVVYFKRGQVKEDFKVKF
ncbi:methyltransferase family protein [Arcticibacter pallidicorallinus]|uniref:Methyltransferase family protein n=1 Tax=Arcticibacter pallidicorallinus TaxID=1259464 RepID=A0A2T0U8V5_9SPHI|nr:class I SAM-dependent methyltransferase [Arcticibacter pallidicorallinus]PRY54312.1 methyltransferase family protein [Arcticibacter pallidicorallinus]